MRLIGYVRVSTDDQSRNGRSMAQQPDRLRAYCTLHEHELVEVITDDGVSASVPLRKREGGAQLVDMLRAGEADGVVVVRLDRLFRNALDGMEFFERTLRGTGATVHSISEHIDTTTPLGKFSLGMQLLSAAYERDLAVQRATDCNSALRRDGRVYGGVPYGCIARDGHLFRDPRTWPMREMIVRNLRGGTSLRIQQAALADGGVRSPTGKARWAINTLWALQDHHDELSHLPFAQPATGSAATPEAGASHAPQVH